MSMLLHHMFEQLNIILCVPGVLWKKHDKVKIGSNEGKKHQIKLFWWTADHVLI